MPVDPSVSPDWKLCLARHVAPARHTLFLLSIPLELESEAVSPEVRAVMAAESLPCRPHRPTQTVAAPLRVLLLLPSPTLPSPMLLATS